MLSDNKIKRVRQTKFYSITEMNGVLATGVAAASAASTAEVDTDKGAVALNMADDESVNLFLRLPTHVDRNQNIRFYVVFSSVSTTTGDDFDFTLEYKELAYDGTDTIIADPATALDTDIPATTKGGTTANTLQTAGPGILNGLTLAEATRVLLLQLTGTILDAAADIYGIEIEYTWKQYKGARAGEDPVWQNKN